MATRNKIIGGPSRLDLMFAFFDGKIKSPRTVMFVAIAIDAATGKRFSMTMSEMVIPSLKRIGDDNWEFTAFSQALGENYGAPSLQGVYDTHTRKGWFELVQK